MDGATIVLSAFDPAAYAADPLARNINAAPQGYNYWVTPNEDGTFQSRRRAAGDIPRHRDQAGVLPRRHF